MSNLQHIKPAVFEPNDPSLQDALKDSSVSRVVLLRNPKSIGVVRGHTLFSGSKKDISYNQKNVPCDLYIDLIGRTMINSNGESYPLKSSPNRITTLLLCLINKYPNPVHKYDFTDFIGKDLTKDSFRKAFSDLRKIIGEIVLPKESRAFNPQSKIIIEKERK